MTHTSPGTKLTWSAYTSSSNGAWPWGRVGGILKKTQLLYD